MKTLLSILLLFLAQFFFTQEIVGSWKGDLEIQGMKLPIILNISKTEKGYSSTLDSPNQSATGIPVDNTQYQNGTLKIEVNKLNLQFIAYLEKENISSGGISIFKDGKEIYQRTFGEQNLPHFNKKNKLFQIGSVTKTMTAVMMVQLANENKLSFGDLLSKYFPQVPNAEKITLLQMLNHSSGLADYTDNNLEPQWLKRKATETEILDHISKQASIFEPGTSVVYSNSAYYLLTKILEKVSGKSFDENLKVRILQPLGMKNTFPVNQKPAYVFPSFEYKEKWTLVKDFDFTNVVGVGDIAAIPSDLNIFISALFDGKLIPLESLQEMLPEGNARFGEGIHTVPFHNKVFLGHSGGTYGTNSLMIHHKTDGLSVSYSLNASKINSKQFVSAVLGSLYGIEIDYPKLSNEKQP
jgi:D-alanyl-D-alanine carboxypeptidase